MIQVENISRSFGDLKAVNDLSFRVNTGEIFALLGPNGAGKTTTIKIILSMLKPDSGRIRFDGKEISSEDNGYKSRIGYVPESCALYENLTGFEFLQFIGNLHHIPEDEIKSKGDSLLEALDLGEVSNQLIREYSKGMKQKILIVSAFLHDPDVIILDEPFAGLDANAVSVFKEIFREQANQGKALVFCSHILEVVERLVDRILIIKEGQKLVTGTPEEIISKTGHTSLDRAFNELTGAQDIDSKARDIVDIIGNRNGKNNE
ncbi:MAG: ABC transporter ATP-binding protein [candidate division Zixibacteria bacterium]|nr:ABC transporter ATP-binding protein [candidate division Zixibacteria bacterium]